MLSGIPFDYCDFEHDWPSFICYVSYFLTQRCSTEKFDVLVVKYILNYFVNHFCLLQELERYRKLAMRKARDTSRGTGTEKHSR